MGRSSEGASRFPDPGEGLEQLQESWQAIGDIVQQRGGAVDASSLAMGRPRDLPQLRASLHAGEPVPGGVITLLGAVPHAHLRWRIPDARDVRWVTWGCARWSAAEVVRAEQHRRQWVEEVFHRLRDPYDAVWQDAFGFMVLRNDDVVGVETTSGYVVYLSHDDDDAHGALLGTSVVDFVRRWTILGCPGPDGVAWQQFTDADGIGITGVAAQQWLEWFIPNHERDGA